MKIGTKSNCKRFSSIIAILGITFAATAAAATTFDRFGCDNNEMFCGSIDDDDDDDEDIADDDDDDDEDDDDDDDDDKEIDR
ncbi:hypothetical protein QR98_0013100 [Sarcoptes scabiei]|uniref:Uncharacterized protein n=1 Tax=Sarcoptes scabiei TaxID=52283 RepID=A0A131ZVX4_SARSC|nr:hypothetical protein QR98_0013100 [Sarcoptes scabiei]